MCRKLSIAFILLSLLLVGCGKEEPVEEAPPVTYLHEQQDMSVWDDKTISAITPCCAFDNTFDKLIVYPYFDNDYSVSVEKLLLSEDNDFWGAITADYNNSDNVVTREGYSLVTFDNGNTVGKVDIDDTTCYWVQSSELPSGYVQAVLKQLCQ